MGKMGEGSHRVPEGWSLLPSHLIATPCLLPSSLCTPRPCLALSLCPTLSSLLLSSQGHSVLFIFLNNLFGLVEAAVVCSVVVCRLSCPKVCGILVPRPGIKPMFPALEGWFAATGLAGKSPPFPSPLGPLSPAHWLSPQDAHQAGRLLPQPDVPHDSESSGATRLSSLPPVGGSYSRSVSSNSFLAWALRTSSPMLVSTLFPWLAWVVIYC